MIDGAALVAEPARAAAAAPACVRAPALVMPQHERIVVGICTCNRPDMLERLLQQLESIQLTRLAGVKVTIVVVDNRPNGSAASLCADAATRLSVPLLYREEHNRGISHARNRIVAEALNLNADLLAFIDDDDMPETDWLAELVQRQIETGADIVMGNRTYVVPETAAACVRDRLSQPKTDNKTQLWKANGLPHQLSTCNVLIHKRVLRGFAAKGPVFDPAFALMGGGDADFFCRARIAGFAFARAERSFIRFRVWPHRATMGGVVQRKFKGGFSQGLLVRRYLSNGHRLRWLGEVLLGILRSALLLPIEIFSSNKAVRRISKIGWSFGALYGFIGGRYEYYSRA